MVLTVLNGSTGRNHATEVTIAPYVLSRSFDSGFAAGVELRGSG